MYLGPCPGRTPRRTTPAGFRDHARDDLKSWARPAPVVLTRWERLVVWCKIKLNTREVQEARADAWAKLLERFPADPEE